MQLLVQVEVRNDIGTEDIPLFERQRQANIARNKERLAVLGLHTQEPAASMPPGTPEIQVDWNRWQAGMNTRDVLHESIKIQHKGCFYVVG